MYTNKININTNEYKRREIKSKQ